VIIVSKIGENIAIMRKRLGLTQEELATKMGYKSKSTINKIELGINDIPQSKIVRFAEILGTTPAALMGWEKVQKNNDAIVGIVQRLRTDDAFLSLVEKLAGMDAERLDSLAAFLK
jgi:transcriptional regulator with XRE-family HTH domain